MLGQVVQNKCVRSRILVTKVRFEPGSNWFRKFRNCLNLELNLRFSSAKSLNLNLNLGSVQSGSGSNQGSEPNHGNTRCICKKSEQRRLACNHA